MKLPSHWNHRSLRMLLAFAALAVAGFVYGSGLAGLPTAAQHYTEQSGISKCDTDPKCAEERSNRRIADYTFWLMIFTGALAAVSAIQIGFLISADRRASESADAALKQMLLTGRQADLLEVQKEIQQLQYFAEHRPKLVVKDVLFDLDGDLTFELANVGGSRASITDGWAAIGYMPDERRFKLREGLEIADLDGRTFSAGELKSITMHVGPEWVLEFIDGRVGIDIARNFYFYGLFHYVDERGAEFGVERLAIFRRKWDPNQKRFHRLRNDDFEYSD